MPGQAEYQIRYKKKKLQEDPTYFIIKQREIYEKHRETILLRKKKYRLMKKMFKEQCNYIDLFEINNKFALM